MFHRMFNLPLEEKDSLFVFGPRGTGKTAWLKHHLAQMEHIYIDLLDSQQFREFFARPERLATLVPENFSGWVVIDEVQKVPELLDEVHRLIESQSIRFILTGSSARKLKRSGVNLLAGRAIRYSLYPMIPQELGETFDLVFALKYGLLPAVFNYSDPQGYLASYVDTYLREEVIQEGVTRNLSAFTRFLEVASFSQGAVLNVSEIARELALSRSVVQSYFSILEDLLLGVRLPAFTKRAKRQVLSTDKFYYFDVGVYQYLRPKGPLDAPSEIAGAALETLFLQCARALIAYKKLKLELYFWRTATGAEIDFIAYGEAGLSAFEIKHSQKITPKMLKGLKLFKQDYPMARCFILYLGTERLYLAEGIQAIPMQVALEQLEQLLVG